MKENEQKRIIFLLKGFFFAAFLLIETPFFSFSFGQTQENPKIIFNENIIHQLMQNNLEKEDPAEILFYVLSQTGETIMVYPTEGYYYFNFYNGGEEIKGNLQFDVELTKKRKFAFTYFSVRNPLAQDNLFFHQEFGPADGLNLENQGGGKFLLEYKGIRRNIELYFPKNPQIPLLAKNETFIGPIFDESGVQFHFLFLNGLNRFIYVLNEFVAAPEEYQILDTKGLLFLGKRTGFVFLKDKLLNRKVLIGVYAPNIRKNNFYDGPFDQLPDRFISGEMLKGYIEKAYPFLISKIGPYGVFVNEEDTRVAIIGYKSFDFVQELYPLVACAENNIGEQLYACLYKIFDGEN